MHPQLRDLLAGGLPSPAALERAQESNSKSPPPPSICPKQFRRKLCQEQRAVSPAPPARGSDAPRPGN